MSDTPRTDLMVSTGTWNVVSLCRQLERENAELLEALKKCRKAFVTDARQKLIVGDETIYQLDGNTVYHALNAARDAIAKAESK